MITVHGTAAGINEAFHAGVTRGYEHVEESGCIDRMGGQRIPDGTRDGTEGSLVCDQVDSLAGFVAGIEIPDVAFDEFHVGKIQIGFKVGYGTRQQVVEDADLSRLMFRPENWYPDNDVNIRLSTEAIAIDRSAKTVTLSDGSTLHYQFLALATGATRRRLPAEVGGDLDGVFTVRDYRDADRLGLEMQEGRRALVIGGGYIGLEAAAVARGRGLHVTVIEMADRILARVASPATATILKAIHNARGVDVREKTGLVRLLGENGRVTGAELSDGFVLPVDVVIAGIGVTANDQLARAAGLEVANGIVKALEILGDHATKPLVVRLDGNNVAEGRRILEAANHPLVTLADTMDGAADKAAELANA